MAAHISSLKPNIWKEFRLIAGDGTTISLSASPKIKTHFGIYELTKGGTHTVLANYAILYDVLSNLVINTTMDLISKGEITLMNQLIDKASFSNTILLLDRGFGYFSICKRLSNKQLDFCIRSKAKGCAFAKAALTNPVDDYIMDWIPSDLKVAPVKNTIWI